MINDYESTDVSSTRFRMDSGIEVLEEWAENARQSRKNAVYRALFAVAAGTVFRTYRIVDDFRNANEFFVVLKDDLVVKVRMNDFDSFGVVYIGHSEDARLDIGFPA